MDREGVIRGIAGPVITAESKVSTRLYEVVKVGNERLLGEVIRIRGPFVDVQVYEDTNGLRVGEPVFLVESFFLWNSVLVFLVLFWMG